MKKLSLYVFLVLMFCNVGVAEDVNFNLKLSCTIIEEKRIYGKKHYEWRKASNQKPEIYSLEKIIKNNKIKTWWLHPEGKPPLMAFDWFKQLISDDDKLAEIDIIELRIQKQLEKEFKQPDQTMFFDTVEGVGYEHAYLSKDNSELMFIIVISDPEFLKENNIKSRTIFLKQKC